MEEGTVFLSLLTRPAGIEHLCLMHLARQQTTYTAACVPWSFLTQSLHVLPSTHDPTPMDAAKPTQGTLLQISPCSLHLCFSAQLASNRSLDICGQGVSARICCYNQILLWVVDQNHMSTLLTVKMASIFHREWPFSCSYFCLDRVKEIRGRDGKSCCRGR